VREDERDGLWMLVLDKLRQLLRISPAKILEVSSLAVDRLHQPVDQPLGYFYPVCFAQNFAGVVDTALNEEPTRRKILLILIEAELDLVRGYFIQVRYGSGDAVRFFLFQATDRILPEIGETLARYAARMLARRRGASLRTDAPVESVEPGKVHLRDETIAAETIGALRALPGVNGAHLYAIEWPEAIPQVVARAGLDQRPKVKEEVTA